MLDPLPEPERLATHRASARTRRAPRGWPRSPIAWTATARPPSAASRTSAGEVVAAHQLEAVAGVGERLQHAGGARAERAVEERLHRARPAASPSPNPVRSSAAAQTADPVGRCAAVTRRVSERSTCSCLPDREPAVALEVVDLRDARRVRRRLRGVDGGPGGGRRGAPAAARSHASCSRSAAVGRDRAGQLLRPRGQHQRVAVVGPQRDRPVAADLVEQRRAGLAARVGGRQPWPITQSSPAPRRAPRPRARCASPAGRRGSARSPRSGSGRARRRDPAAPCGRRGRSARSRPASLALPRLDAARDRPSRVIGRAVRCGARPGRACRCARSSGSRPVLFRGCRRPSPDRRSNGGSPRSSPRCAEQRSDAALIVESSDLYYLTGTNQDAHLVVPAPARAGLPRAPRPRPGARRVAAGAGRAAQVAARPGRRRFARRPATSTASASSSTSCRSRTTCATRKALPGVDLRRLHAGPAAVARREVGLGGRPHPRCAAQQIRAAYEAVPGCSAHGLTDRELQIEHRARAALARPPGPVPVPRHERRDVLRRGAGRARTRRCPASSDTPFGGWGPSPAIGRGPGRAGSSPAAPASPSTSWAPPTATWPTRRARSSVGAAGRAARHGARGSASRSWPRSRRCSCPGTPWQRPYDARPGARDRGRLRRRAGWAPARPRAFIGHGIGLEINEPPFLARGLDAPLEAGNVIAVEPKLAFPGIGAVGVENTYLVRDDGGPENLTPW